MCTRSCLEFGARQLSLGEIRDKRILEVGSRDVNGGIRLFIERWAQPSDYVGVDIEAGAGVDVTCDVAELVSSFGEESYDLVISTELLEHVQDWRSAISNLKNVCKKGGIIVITTRSCGFRPHAYPFDFWRYEVTDMNEIFSDCEILAIEADPHAPGVFIKVKKPYDFKERDLQNVNLYSVLLNKRVNDISDNCSPGFNYRRMQIESRLWRSIRNIVKWMSKHQV